MLESRGGAVCEGGSAAARVPSLTRDRRVVDSPRLLFSLMLFSCSCSNRTATTTTAAGRDISCVSVAARTAQSLNIT